MNHEKRIKDVTVRSVLSSNVYKMIGFRMSSIPNNASLEGWLVDTNTDYKLSLGKVNEKGNLVFGQRMINPWIYDVLVITEEPIDDADPAPNKPVGGIKLQTPFGQ